MVISLILNILLSSSVGFCWGERGHNIVGHDAAMVFSEKLPANDKALIGDSFRTRVFQMGHLANIPDFSWKDDRKKVFRAFNNSTHHLNPEKILGNPGPDPKAFAAKIKSLETDLSKLKETYKSFSPEYDPGHKFILEIELGTAPWRTEELYNKMVEALKCSKGKEISLVNDKYKSFTDPFTASSNYECSSKTTWNEDLYAAFAYAGIMGHFIGDLSQPLHVTSDFNGAYEGQGGLHNYFETLLLENYDKYLMPDVETKAESAEYQNKIWNHLKPDFSKPHAVTQLALNLAADSYEQLKPLLALDKKLSLTKEGEHMARTQAWPSVWATRKSASDAKVLAGYRSFVVSRLATSALLLSKLWYQAWTDAGKPDLSKFGYLAAPYPTDVPFLKASYLSGINELDVPN